MKIKQHISTVVYLILSACLLGGVVFLGSHYVSENTADVPMKETECENDDTVSTDDFIESEAPPAVKIESTDETSAPETEPETEPETVNRLDALIESLYLLFEEAPTRWEKYEEADWSRVKKDEETSFESESVFYESVPESGISEDEIIPEPEMIPAEIEPETELDEGRTPEENGQESEETEALPEFVEMYPKLAYYYKDLKTGRTVSYNADEILYSASLIKAPYVYSVMEEIDKFFTAKFPPEETEEIAETAADGDVPETEENIQPEEIVPETETEIPDEEVIPTDAGEINEESAETAAETEEAKMVWELLEEYTPWESRYNLGEIWVYDPETMFEEGSGELQKMPAGTELTWMELFDYALLYSDNVAFAQIREKFGYTSFYNKAGALGIEGTKTGFMNLSARDCGIFLEAMYEYFCTESFFAEHMRDIMADSKKLNMIASLYPDGMAPHKYGWDINAFHDMAIILDENPYIIVIMTDYEDGGLVPGQFFEDAVNLTKEIHAELHKDDPIETETVPETDIPETEIQS